MIYKPEELKRQIIDAIKTFYIAEDDDRKDIEGYIEEKAFYDFIVEDEEDPEEETVITAASNMYFDLESSPDTFKVSDLLALAKRFKEATMDDFNSRLSGNKWMYQAVQAADLESQYFLDMINDSESEILEDYISHKTLWEKEIPYKESLYKVRIWKGFSIFNLYVEKCCDTEDFNPYDVIQYFINIESDDKLDWGFCEELIEAFIFELHSTHGLNLQRASHPFIAEPEEFYDMEEKNLEIFPLLTGKGMHALICIYNKFLSASDYDYAILNLTRVIEYVAPTVARGQLNQVMMAKLKSPKVINPDAEYVKELEILFSNYNDSMRDRELIKLAMVQILDLDELKECIPNFIGVTISEKISQKEREKQLKKIATHITDTRNEISHAKVNYSKSGNECPEQEKREFVVMLDEIARQVIRWYALQPEVKRQL